MASLASPFKRFLSSSSCVRVAASHARPSPGALKTPVLDEDELDASPGARPAEQLNVLLTSVSDVPYNFSPRGRTSDGKTPIVVPFQDQGLIRPRDLHRDAQKRSPFRKRANIGPGRESRYEDIFLQFGIDPRREADNEALMSSYMTRLGRIQPRNITQLSQRSQRLVGKAIKRAKMMGVIPILNNRKYRELTPLRHTSRPDTERKDRTDRSV